MVIELLETARYFGKGDGYQVSAGVEELTDDPQVMERAKVKLRYMKDAMIVMHEFVMEYLDT